MKAQAREFQAKRSMVEIKLVDGTRVKGRVVTVDEDSFTLDPKQPPARVVKYVDVTKIQKTGLSKSVMIPLIVGSGAILVFCAAPYPIGSLCRKDPS